MQVKKRDGRLQPYDPSKIGIVLAYISDELHMPLSEGDLRVLVETMDRRIRALEQDPMPSSVIRQMVPQVLRANGFEAIAQAYEKQKKAEARDSAVHDDGERPES